MCIIFAIHSFLIDLASFVNSNICDVKMIIFSLHFKHVKTTIWMTSIERCHSSLISCTVLISIELIIFVISFYNFRTKIGRDYLFFYRNRLNIDMNKHGMLIEQLSMIIDEEQKTRIGVQFLIYFCHVSWITLSDRESNHSFVLLIHRNRDTQNT